MKRLTSVLALLAVLGSFSCSRDPDVVKRKYVENGNRYFARGKYKEASIMYRSALKKDQRYAEAYYRLGLTFLKLNEPIQATRSLQRAVSLWKEQRRKGPEVDDGRGKLADLYLAAYFFDPKRPKYIYDEMKALAGDILSADPRSFDGMRLQGYLALIDGDRKRAIERFQAANSVRPMNPDVVLALCQVLSWEGRFPEAEQLARALIENQKSFSPIYDFLAYQYAGKNRIAEAQAVFELLVHNNPKEIQYALKLANFYRLAKKNEECERVLQGILSNPKDFPDRWMQVGNFYRRAQEFDKALEVYSRGMKSEPKRKLDYEKNIAEIFAAQGKKEQAAKVVDEILQSSPKDPVAQAMKATLMLESGNPQQLKTVIDDLQASLAKLPNSPHVRFNLGRAYCAKGDLEKARMQFQLAIKLRPDYVAPRVWLAEVERLRGDYGASIQTAEEALKYQPDNFQARLIRALALRSMGDSDQARKELVALVQNNPNAIDARLQLGILELQQGNYKEAENSFSRCIAFSPPTDVRCVVGLTQTYNSQKQYDRAMQVLNEAAKKTPSQPEIRTMIANTAVLSGNYDMAVNIYKELLAKEPKSLEIQLRLAETYRRKGDTDLAIENFKKARDLQPNDPRAYIPLALVLDEIGRKQEAKQCYEQVLKLQPDNPVVLNNLAYVITEIGGDLDLALTYVQKAKQKLPQDPNVADTLGWIYIKKNLSNSAIEVYKPLVARVPNNPTFHYHLGMAYFQKGDKTAARRALEAALRSRPSKAEEGKIRELLAKIG
jgi:tetratricopeptide (TPR) repeat protein